MEYWIAGIAKYRRMLALQWAGYFESPLVFTGYLHRILWIMLLLSIWRLILTGKGEVSGMTLESVLTYTLIAEVFADPLACWTGMGLAFRSGEVVSRFLRPMSVIRQFALESISKWCISFLFFSIPVLLLGPVLGANPLPYSLTHAGWFVVSLVLAVSVGMALESGFSALVVLLGQGDYSVNVLRGGLTYLLSGSILPLALYPWGIGKVFGWLPFASMASAPLRIYTGTGDPLLLIGVQVGWTLILWPAVGLLWRSQRERIVTFGG